MVAHRRHHDHNVQQPTAALRQRSTLRATERVLLPIFLPHWTWTAPQIVTTMLLLSAPLVFFGEARGWMAMGYSKFTPDGARFTLPSRTGMLVIYAPAALMAPLVAWGLGWPDSRWHTVVLALVTMHFVKRCAETLWVHRYSGEAQLSSVVFISFAYSTYAWLLISVAATEVPAGRTTSPVFTTWLAPGLTLWAIGTLGNAWHHLLLARLRSDGSSGYVVPRGGLFRWVACPHYTFELLAWLGLALLFRHVSAWVLLLSMTAYLSGRAHRTLGWYRSTLGSELPARWGRLIPGVF